MGWFKYSALLRYNMLLTAIDFLLLGVLTTLTTLLAGYIGYRLVKKRLIQPIAGQLQLIPAQIGKQLGSSIEKATENLDIGALAGQLGGGEGGVEGLGALAGLLGGDSGGIGQLLGLLQGLGGKQTTKKGGKIGL